MVSGTHTIPISLGILMGPAYHFRGVPCPWGSLKITLDGSELHRLEMFIQRIFQVLVIGGRDYITPKRRQGL